MDITVTPARRDDLESIVATMTANRGDPSLFQQPKRQVERSLREFLVARRADAVVGCIQVHRHPFGSVEILAVAVRPERQGEGVGEALVQAAVARARAVSRGRVWLGTAKPAYFARHGFSPMARWRLPLVVLVGKLVRVVQQPPRRWLPAVFGRHVFMSQAGSTGLR